MIEFIDISKLYNNNTSDNNEIVIYRNQTNYLPPLKYNGFIFMVLYVLTILFFIKSMKIIYTRCNSCYIINCPRTYSTPHFEYTNIDNINNDDECPICLEKIKNKETIKLNCNHIFHKKCIKRWINETNNNPNLDITCPLCKVNII